MIARLRAVPCAVPRAVWVVLALAYATGIHQLSALSGASFGEHGPIVRWLGNLFHAPLYFGLAMLIGLALVERSAVAPMSRMGAGHGLPAPRAAAAWCAAVAYGVIDEWHQSFVGGRSSDSFDLVTDAAGAAVAVLVLRAVLDAGPEARPHRFRARAAAAGAFALVAIASSCLATHSAPGARA